MQDKALIFLHLKLVAKISVAVGAVAVLSLLVSLLLIPVPVGDSYEAIIRSKSITREQLGPFMLLIGLGLVAVAAAITWVITLYSSFRIAGPLYRFTENLKLASLDDVTELTGLRRGDSLHAQQETIRHAVESLRTHYGAVEEASSQALNAIENRDAEAYAMAVQRLRELDEKIRV